MKKFLILIVAAFGIWYLAFGIVRAQECPSSNYDCQISQIQREIDALSPAHEKNKQELADLRSKIKDLGNRIGLLTKQLKETETQIANREDDLAFATEIFNQKAVSQYKFSRLYDPIAPFLFSDSASEAFREISFRQKAADSDRITMEEYAKDISELKIDKGKLENNKTSLASAQKTVDEKADFLEGEVEKVETYIGTLTSKQNELAALKSGGFQTSIGDTPPTLEPCSGAPGSSNFCDPGFRPAFAGFSFGAPHRTGMSQYGAYGRSKSGQSAETILSAYYQGAELNKNYPVPSTIAVSGFGNIPFEDNYLLGIYEVPESWGEGGGLEALKAQAVAARSYALYATKPICTTEKCQVYRPQLKSGKWAEAVRATRGWVITKGGSPTATYYAASSGGYTISQWGWSGIKDAPGDWPATAYEKIGASPWFYKGWYKNRAGASCGKGSPWLTSEEMADILNAWKVVYQGGGDTGRIWPEDCLGQGHNPYSKSELQSIGGFTSVSSVSVIYSNSGSTQSVTFSTNKGSVSMSGDELKKAFNLRAPGYIGLKSSLFNIEKL